MLTVNRRHSIHKQFQATRDRQICRAWRVERHDKTGRQHRSARWVLAITGLRKPTCTGRMIKKCSLAVIGKVSAPASRIQVALNSVVQTTVLKHFPTLDLLGIKVFHTVVKTQFYFRQEAAPMTTANFGTGRSFDVVLGITTRPLDDHIDAPRYTFSSPRCASLVPL